MPNLKRFHTAQSNKVNGYVQAKKEISEGRKTGHWIWYILPQLQMLGRSDNAQYYGIADFEEACDYLCDETLFKHYHKVIKLIESQLEKNLSLEQLMGWDDVKLISSLTLFREAASYLDSQKGNPSNDFNDLKKRCDNIFAMIAKHPCMQTESYLQSAPKPAINVKPPAIKTTSVKPAVTRPKTTLFVPSVVHTKTTPDEPTVIHTKSIPDEPPIVHTKTTSDEPTVVPIKTTRDESSVPTPITPVKNPELPEALSPLIPRLEGYIDMRRNEWSFHYNFLGLVSLIYLIMDTISGSDHFHEKSRDVKISAATKLKQILDPTAPELSAPLTHAERAALKEGRLGELVGEHGSLEQLLQNVPEKQIIEDSANHPFSF